MDHLAVRKPKKLDHGTTIDPLNEPVRKGHSNMAAILGALGLCGADAIAFDGTVGLNL